MRALPKKFLQGLQQGVTQVRGWLGARRKLLDQHVNAVQPRHANLLDTLVPSFFILGLAGGAISLIASIATSEMDRYGEIVDFHWHWIGNVWLGLLAIGIPLLIVLSKAIGKARREMQATTRVQLEAEHRAHPLVQRAELIDRAVRDYFFHCDRYREWKQQVDDELVAEDAAAAERYLAFLERAREVLERAIANFTAVAERAAREETYLAQHPELQNQTEGTALTLLLDELKADVEKPELPQAILDPIRALEHEEQLAAVAAELGQHEAATG